jgi:hypothetical protein
VVIHPGGPDERFALEVLRAASEQVAQRPPERASACEVCLDALDLVFTCVVRHHGNDPIAYRIEAVPVDHRSAAAWPDTMVTNWTEAVEAADAPPPKRGGFAVVGPT